MGSESQRAEQRQARIVITWLPAPGYPEDHVDARMIGIIRRATAKLTVEGGRVAADVDIDTSWERDRLRLVPAASAAADPQPADLGGKASQPGGPSDGPG